MKKIIKFMVCNLVYIYPFWLNDKIKRYRNYIYSKWLSRGFKSQGVNTLFYYPAYIKNSIYISIGDNFIGGYRTRIEAWDCYAGVSYEPTIIIGSNVCLNYDCHLGAINKISIGNNVLIGSRVLITDHNHGQVNQNDLILPPGERKLFSSGPVLIGDNVWIGESVCILANVQIGKNCIVAAGSVVTANTFPDNCLIAGVPAKIIKYLE